LIGAAGRARAVLDAPRADAPPDPVDWSHLIPYASGPRSWRERAQDLRLEGSRCNGCSRVLFPAPSTCPHCGSRDLAPHRLARAGSVVTETRDHAYPVSPSTGMAVVELDDGDFSAGAARFEELLGRGVDNAEHIRELMRQRLKASRGSGLGDPDHPEEIETAPAVPAELGEVLAGLRAEATAVIDTGERQVAFVALGHGRFEPRTVHMGAQVENGKVEILDGLRSGELVVVSGQFLIDSEARMREALARMMKGKPVGEATAPKPPTTENETLTVTLPDAANTALGAALDAYLVIGKALANDSNTDIGVYARKVADAIDALVAMSIPNQPHFWHEHGEAADVRKRATELAAAGTLDEARRAFAALSNMFSKLLHATGVPKAYAQKLEDAHCPMYPSGSEGGSVWIQATGVVHNPYFGKAMATCADWQRPLEVAK